MQVEIKLAGLFKKYASIKEENKKIFLKEECSVSAIAKKIGINIDENKIRALIFVNDRIEDPNYVAKDGDKIILMNMLVGG